MKKRPSGSRRRSKPRMPSPKGLGHLQYRIQISPMDCTGCANCADICPAKGKALIMKPADQEIEMESENWEFAMTVTDKSELVDTKTVIGSQFATAAAGVQRRVPRLRGNAVYTAAHPAVRKKDDHFQCDRLLLHLGSLRAVHRLYDRCRGKGSRLDQSAL